MGRMQTRAGPPGRAKRAPISAAATTRRPPIAGAGFLRISSIGIVRLQPVQ